MPMTCPDARDRFAPWLDEQLAPGEQELLEHHLAACAGCAEELARIDEQRFVAPPLPGPRGPEFWAPMDHTLALALAQLPERTSPPRIPWYRRELRLSSGQALLLAAALLLALGLAGVQSWQLATVSAQAEALQARLERDERQLVAAPPELPREPHVVAVHTPHRGSL